MVFEIAAFIGTAATIFTRELTHGDHIFSGFAAWTRDVKNDNLVTWFIWKYTSCELCLSGMSGLLTAGGLVYLGGSPYSLLTLPVYAMLCAGVVRRYVF